MAHISMLGAVIHTAAHRGLPNTVTPHTGYTTFPKVLILFSPSFLTCKLRIVSLLPLHGMNIHTHKTQNHNIYHSNHYSLRLFVFAVLEIELRALWLLGIYPIWAMSPVYNHYSWEWQHYCYYFLILLSLGFLSTSLKLLLNKLGLRKCDSHCC
jgi:hypothetical protein